MEPPCNLHTSHEHCSGFLPDSNTVSGLNLFSWKNVCAPTLDSAEKLYSHIAFSSTEVNCIFFSSPFHGFLLSYYVHLRILDARLSKECSWKFFKGNLKKVPSRRFYTFSIFYCYTGLRLFTLYAEKILSGCAFWSRKLKGWGLYFQTKFSFESLFVRFYFFECDSPLA